MPLNDNKSLMPLMFEDDDDNKKYLKYNQTNIPHKAIIQKFNNKLFIHEKCFSIFT